MKQYIDQQTYSLLLRKGYHVLVEFHNGGSPLHYVVMNKGKQHESI